MRNPGDMMEGGGGYSLNVGVHFSLFHQLDAFVEVGAEVAQLFIHFLALCVRSGFLGGCYLEQVV